MSPGPIDRFEIRVDAGGNVLLKDHRERKAYRTGYGTEGRYAALRMIEDIRNKEEEVIEEPRTGA